MPTAVPITAFSSTALAVASVSLTARTSNSSTSLTSMVKIWSVNDPSLLVARTVMFELGPSASRSIAPATVTTPVLASIANRPPSSSVSGR